jgi:hypothetical protein
MRPIRISEVGTMGTCEKMWQYRYVLEQEDPASGPMIKGTLLHAYYAAWWKNGQPNNVFALGPDKVINEINPDHRDEVSDHLDKHPEVADDAIWLFGRFCKVHGGRNTFELVESELELEAEVDGLLLQGRADALVRHVESGKLYLGECKSMRDWRRLDILQVDPQVTHYYLLLQAAGYPVHGVMYDALKTYRWKRDEHPPEDSIQRIFLDRTAEQCEASLDDLRAFRANAEAIEGKVRLPLRNISSFGSCSFCNYRPQCWEELAFPETEIIVLGGE